MRWFLFHFAHFDVSNTFDIQMKSSEIIDKW